MEMASNARTRAHAHAHVEPDSAALLGGASDVVGETPGEGMSEVCNVGIIYRGVCTPDRRVWSRS